MKMLSFFLVVLTEIR